MRIKMFFLQCLLCILFVGSLLGSLDIQKPSIVFVHIGNKIPIYLETAIKQARLFNSCNIILVANECALKQSQSSLEKFDTECVACESLSKTPEHLAFCRNANLDRTFRNGFWTYTTERFFYLQDLIKQYNLHGVVHLESDNMIYVDISTLMPIFKTLYPHIGMTLESKERCVPGFVYIADAESINHLAQFVLVTATYGKSNWSVGMAMDDMESLAYYYHNFAGFYVDKLPIIMKSYWCKVCQKTPANFSYCKNEEEFLSIFDAAALGQYLGGTDPANSISKPGYINTFSVFNPSHLNYSWKMDEKARQVPYAKFGVTEYRINNLHVHSKNLQLFLSDREGCMPSL